MKKNYYILLCESYISADTPKKKAVYEFDNLDSAVASWHSTLGASMKKSDVKHVFCSVIGDDGYAIRVDSWTRPDTDEEANLNI